MAKKPQTTKEAEEQQRQSRKEILIARKHERQLHAVRIAVIVILALIGVVIGVAVINELFLAPNRAVATVGDKQITMREWQNRVKYDRAQRIIFLDNQLEAFGGDVGIVQQFGGQVITDLMEPETLGQNAIDRMAEDMVICDALAERGVTISEAEIDAKIGESFGYFGGQSPTAEPSPTETIQPTPSLTPITLAGTTPEPTLAPEPTATAGPSPTPFPTATPVSQEAFQEEFGGLLTQFKDLGVDEATYRNVVKAQICRERLTETLATEQTLATVEPHASFFLIAADSEEEANAELAKVQSGDFLTEWNTIRSQPAPAADGEDTQTTFAYELLWRTQDALESTIGSDIAAAAFSSGINEPTSIITATNSDGSTSYYIMMVSGREDRPLDEQELQTRKEQALQQFVDDQLASNLVVNEIWRTRIPTTPVLDPKFLAQPTAAPTVAATTAPVETAPAEIIPTEVPPTVEP